MFSEIIDLAKAELGQKITGNSSLNASQAEETVAIGGETIFDTLKKELLSGNISQITNIFSQGSLDFNNPLVQNIESNFITNIISRLGIPESTAKNVVNMVLPYIMSMIGNKVGGSNADSGSLLNMFTGSSNSGLLGEAANLLGGFFKKD